MNDRHRIRMKPNSSQNIDELMFTHRIRMKSNSLQNIKPD